MTCSRRLVHVTGELNNVADPSVTQVVGGLRKRCRSRTSTIRCPCHACLERIGPHAPGRKLNPLEVAAEVTHAILAVAFGAVWRDLPICTLSIRVTGTGLTLKLTPVAGPLATVDAWLA